MNIFIASWNEWSGLILPIQGEISTNVTLSTLVMQKSLEQLLEGNYKREG